MKSAHKIPAPGEIRQSQLITTFGPGAMLDLPDHSVVIAGLEHWWGEKRRIHEARLEDRLREQLELPEVALYAPPVDSDTSGRTRVGVKTYVFPAWFVAQEDDASSTYTDPGGRVYRSRPLVHWRRLQQGRFRSETARRLVSVVPVRFVQGCKNGHLSDIDWYAFVHGSFSNPCRLQLYLQEGGTGGDLADIFVRCACGARRVLGLVKMEKAAVLGHCTGQRPWLGKMAAEPCIARGGSGEAEPNRLLVRSASNAYFPQVLSVISLPDRGAALRQAVDELWEDELQHEESEADVARLRKRRPKINARLDGFTDAEVFGEMLRRRGPPAPGPSLKQVEIETLLAAKEDESDDVPEVDFFAQARPLTGLSSAFRARIARVVLVHRLREVTAQLGFTRFEAVTPTIEGEIDESLQLGVQRASLALDTKWLPAIENRGEGVFVAFSPEAIDAWRSREAVKARGRQLEAGFEAWKRDKGLPAELRFVGLPYLMLHSLAHLLITAVSLECGYSASSIRERVYAGQGGYGILLYTGSSGSEGTLGGLVQVGLHLEAHLRAALDLGRLCSSDPICAQHRPDDPHEERFLHGAACHGCLLIAEPSCERRNDFLDRALVVPTVEGGGAAFFPEGEA